ncbi:DUF7139 domain-containing protein [Haloarchaeobius sp. HRN-SO-5]|uniref:DUF7139 domain-containing protein n=1 Tax=Haloarchaeobius sp. HRN-SO-5 TaxID=3446118 RepID=UPI003EBF3083
MPDEETQDSAEGEAPPDNPLYNLYQRYIGEPEEETDVYLGFGLFFSGIVVGVVALLLTYVSFTSFETGSDPFWNWTRIAYALGMLSLPSTITGIVVLLPVERRAVYASMMGAGVDVLAVVWFVSVYPDQWNEYGVGATLGVISLYALGLVLVVGSTGAALVADQLERYRKPGPADIQPVTEDDSEETESYSEAEIQADIDSAMADVDLSWGGVEKSENRRLQFDVDEEMDTSAFSQQTANVTRSKGVDSQIQNLKAMKGGEAKTATSNTTVDDQTQKLKELRERREREEQRKAEESSSIASAAGGGFFARVKSALGLS